MGEFLFEAYLGVGLLDRSRRGVKLVCAGPSLSSTLASSHSLSKLSSALTLCYGWGEKEERARAPALEDLHSEVELREVQLY